MSLNSTTQKLCGSCQRNKKCSYYDIDGKDSTSNLGWGLKKLEEDVVNIARSSLVSSLLEDSELAYVTNPNLQACNKMKLSNLLKIMNKILIFLQKFNITYLPKLLIVLYSINERIFSMESCSYSHLAGPDSTDNDPQPLFIPHCQ